MKQPKRLEHEGTFVLEFTGSNMAIADNGPLPNVAKLEDDATPKPRKIAKGLALMFRIMQTNHPDFDKGDPVFLLFPVEITGRSHAETKTLIDSGAVLYQFFVTTIANAQDSGMTPEELHDDIAHNHGLGLVGRLRVDLRTTIIQGPPRMMSFTVFGVGWRPLRRVAGPAMTDCPTCFGGGTVPSVSKFPCVACQGTGKVNCTHLN